MRKIGGNEGAPCASFTFLASAYILSKITRRERRGERSKSGRKKASAVDKVVAAVFGGEAHEDK
jgi:hypothetical protein